MIGKYVFDSSIWIEIERKNQRILTLVRPLIAKNEVSLVDIIVAEVLRGSKTGKDYRLLLDMFCQFQIVSTNWLEVANLGFKVAKAGFFPPLADLYIANAVNEHQKILISQDRHFQSIQKVSRFKLVLV